MSKTLHENTEDLLKYLGCDEFYWPFLRAEYEPEPVPEHIPVHVIYNGVTTVAMFPDGKKIKARPDKGAAFDPETGLAMCIAKHVFGSRSAFLKAVEGANDQNEGVQ